MGSTSRQERGRPLDLRPDRGTALMAWATPLSRQALSIELLDHAVPL